MAVKDLIRQRACELGFDECRFTSAAPPDHAEAFRHWIAAGYHGAMAYLERTVAARLAPQQVLPGARSVIVVAVSYAQRPSRPPAGPSGSASAAGLPLHDSVPALRGTVARYARFADYHQVLRPRLRALAEFMDKLGPAGTRSVAHVDTGPVLERDLAARAGVGFIGKHTNLISRRWGNWLLLGEILTTLELEPDAPERPRCGGCRRCLEACPTGALVGPYQLDARRCLAYLTIELKGSIPEPLRPALGGRLFGCDTCLEVCPWNRFAQPGRLMLRHERPDLSELDLVALLDLDQNGFCRRFGHTPISRTKRVGLLRNACVVLGNLGDATTSPALARSARDPDQVVAEHAAWAIRQIEARWAASRSQAPPMSSAV